MFQIPPFCLRDPPAYDNDSESVRSDKIGLSAVSCSETAACEPPNQKSLEIAFKAQCTKQENFQSCFFHPDYTVGIGI
jgi:hypothetical protein